MRVRPVGQTPEFLAIVSHRHRTERRVRGVGVGHKAGGSLPVHIGAAGGVGLEIRDFLCPVLIVWIVAGGIEKTIGVCRIAISRKPRKAAIPGIDVPDHHHVALEAGVVLRGAAPCIRIIPGRAAGIVGIAVNGKSVIHGSRKTVHCRNAIGGCGRLLPPLQIGQSLMIELGHGVVLLVDARIAGVGSAELIQIIDDATDPHGIAFRILHKDAGRGIPLCPCIACGGSIVYPILVEGGLPHILHGRTQHPPEAGSGRIVSRAHLIHGIPECGKSQVLAVLLDHASRLVFTGGIAGTESVITVIQKIAARIHVAYLNAGIKISIRRKMR